MSNYKIVDTRTKDQIIDYIEANSEKEAVSEYLYYISYKDAGNKELWLSPSKGNVISASKVDTSKRPAEVSSEAVWFGVKKTS